MVDFQNLSRLSHLPNSWRWRGNTIPNIAAFEAVIIGEPQQAIVGDGEQANIARGNLNDFAGLSISLLLAIAIGKTILAVEYAEDGDGRQRGYANDNCFFIVHMF